MNGLQGMNVKLLENIHTINNNEMPNWISIMEVINCKNQSNILDLSQSHCTTKMKITFADYHYYILNQMYRPNETDRAGDTDQWVLAETHSIIFNLYSALDSLCHEINLAYKFGLNASQVNVYHYHHSQINPNCIRCRLNKSNDQEKINKSVQEQIDQLSNNSKQILTTKADFFKVVRRLFNQEKETKKIKEI